MVWSNASFFADFQDIRQLNLPTQFHYRMLESMDQTGYRVYRPCPVAVESTNFACDSRTPQISVELAIGESSVSQFIGPVFELDFRSHANS